jgi:uncharacterized protein YbbK (DUF523 family)
VLEKNNPVIGISSCLLGEAVRYDGGHSRHQPIVELIESNNTIIRFCPEVSAQLGTPRPPVELITSDRQIYALGRNDSTLDVTTALNKVATTLINKLITEHAVAYIFKSRSPSCGVGSTPLLNTKKDAFGVTDGLVAAAVLKQLPSLIVVDETAVNNAVKCERFNVACQLALAYHSASDIEQTLQRSQALFPSLQLVRSATDLRWQDILNTHILPILNA